MIDALEKRVDVYHSFAGQERVSRAELRPYNTVDPAVWRGEAICRAH